MAFPAVVIALVPLVIKTVIGAKMIGFVASWVTSPTSASMRTSFLRHVEHVRDGLQYTDFPLGPADDADLLANIETLRSAVRDGWTKPNETLALWSVMKFLSWAHGKATAFGAGKFTASHLGAAYALAEKAGLQFVEFILPENKK